MLVERKSPFPPDWWREGAAIKRSCALASYPDLQSGKLLTCFLLCFKLACMVSTDMLNLALRILIMTIPISDKQKALPVHLAWQGFCAGYRALVLPQALRAVPAGQGRLLRLGTLSQLD